MLTPEELAKLEGAETLFPSPIPVQFVSSDEYMPSPQTRAAEGVRGAHQGERRRAGEEARHDAPQVLQDRRRHGGGVRGDERGARQGRRSRIYEVEKNEATDLDVAQARADGLKNQFVMDMHTHFLREGTPIRAFVAQREAVGKAGWNPALVGKPQTIDDLMFPNYFKEIFLDSDTKVACISGSYSVDEKFSFLTNQMKLDAREKLNKEAGTRRMFSHAIFTPGRDGWLREGRGGERAPQARLVEGLHHRRQHQQAPVQVPVPARRREADVSVLREAGEVVEAKYPDRPGLKNVCIHKGLFPPSVERQFPHLLGYCNVADVGQAAKDWPQLNFVIYHSAYRWVAGPGGTAAAAWDQLQREGRVDWVTDLADIPAKFGVKNVYADLGQIFAHSNMAEPRVAAYMLGIMIKGMGADHVVWGTDSLWTGSPQWQIEALRRMEIPEEIQKKYGLAPMGPADGPVKTAILGGNNARLYGYTPKMMGALQTDKVAYYKALYEKHGSERTNLAYGYVNKG